MEEPGSKFCTVNSIADKLGVTQEAIAFTKCKDIPKDTAVNPTFKCNKRNNDYVYYSFNINCIAAILILH